MRPNIGQHMTFDQLKGQLCFRASSEILRLRWMICQVPFGCLVGTQCTFRDASGDGYLVRIPPVEADKGSGLGSDRIFIAILPTRVDYQVPTTVESQAPTEQALVARVEKLRVGKDGDEDSVASGGTELQSQSQGCYNNVSPGRVLPQWVAVLIQVAKAQGRGVPADLVAHAHAYHHEDVTDGGGGVREETLRSSPRRPRQQPPCTSSAPFPRPTCIRCWTIIRARSDHLSAPASRSLVPKVARLLHSCSPFSAALVSPALLPGGRRRRIQRGTRDRPSHPPKTQPRKQTAYASMPFGTYCSSSLISWEKLNHQL